MTATTDAQYRSRHDPSAAKAVVRLSLTASRAAGALLLSVGPRRHLGLRRQHVHP